MSGEATPSNVGLAVNQLGVASWSGAEVPLPDAVLVDVAPF